MRTKGDGCKAGSPAADTEIKLKMLAVFFINYYCYEAPLRPPGHVVMAEGFLEEVSFKGGGGLEGWGETGLGKEEPLGPEVKNKQTVCKVFLPTAPGCPGPLSRSPGPPPFP